MSTTAPRTDDEYALADESATPADRPAPAAAAAAATPQAAPAAAAGGSKGAPPADKPPVAPAPRRRRNLVVARTLPSWVVSVAMHAGLLILITAVGLSPQVQETVAASLDAALDTSLADEELLKIDSPVQDGERAIDETLTLSSSATSATPNVRPETAQVEERKSLAGIVQAVDIPTPDVSLPPVALNTTNLANRKGLAGDPAREVKEIGDALDQLAAEILRQLNDNRVAVFWMFDESGSMRDDQQAVKEKFQRVIDTLETKVDPARREAGDLLHLILGFGQSLHPSQPTADINKIKSDIDRLPIDESGTENTMDAVATAIANAKLEKDRKLLVVIITDESGDDGTLVENARLAAVDRNATVYVIGRQSMFGYERLHLVYKDPVTGDVYWPAIRRGPEAPGLEQLQWDGLHKERHDEQPAGFGPYELARLTKETGGIYFLLPTEENERVKQREQVYRLEALREYLPDYESRKQYDAKILNSEFRRSLVSIIVDTAGGKFGFERHFPVEPNALAQAILERAPAAELQLVQLLAVEKRLRALEPLRDRETDKRWQANYDLMLAQVVTYQVKAYEYRACLQELLRRVQQGNLRPSRMPEAGKIHVDWVINHSTDRKAPTNETEKKYAEATALLKRVIERHPRTPWADLAQDELNRGLGCQWGEWIVSAQYNERAKLVPKY